MTVVQETSSDPMRSSFPLGEGGMGKDYRARDPSVDREVTLKVSADQFTNRFAFRLIETLIGKKDWEEFP